MDMQKKAALVAVIKLVADAAKDTAAAIQPGQALLSRLAGYGNLVLDVEALLPQIGDLKAELAGLTPPDYVELAGVLVSDLAFSNEKAQGIVATALDLLGELAGPVMTKTLALVAAAKA